MKNLQCRVSFSCSASVLCHKTFHRYVVRAKRGTCQSSRDNKGNSAPKSAGASLRRHNEAALAQVTGVLLLMPTISITSLWHDDVGSRIEGKRKKGKRKIGKLA